MQRLLSISMLLAVMMVISLAQTSNSANSYFQRAKLRLAQGDLDGAISDFDAALVFNPRLADAYVNRGVARYQKLDFASAITDFDKAIEINPRLAIAYNDRGNARLAGKDVEEALADYTKAIAIKPHYAEALYNRANIRPRKGRSDRRNCRLYQRAQGQSQIGICLQQSWECPLHRWRCRWRDC